MKKWLPFTFGSLSFIWQILFFYLPLLLLIAASFEQGGRFYIALLKPIYFKIIFNTIIIATTSAVLCALIAYPVAYFIAFKARRYKYFLLFCLIVPFWTNFLLHVYAWFFILDKEGFVNHFLGFFHLGPLSFLNSLFGIMMMMVYTYLPFMILPIYASLERFDRHILEASEDLGATFIQTFAKIMFPLTLPAVRTGFFLVLIPCFGEFIIPELMGGDKYYFTGNVISQFILGDGTGSLGAAFTVISSICLLIFITPLYKWIQSYE